YFFMEFYRDKEEAWKRHIVTTTNHTDEEAIAAIRRYVRTHRELPEAAQTIGRFEVFSSITLTHPSRLLRFACCPDKDLLLVVSRVGNQDRMALWKLQGAKKWEVDLAKNSLS